MPLDMANFYTFCIFQFFYIFIFVSTVKSIMIAKLQNTRALAREWT